MNEMNITTVYIQRTFMRVDPSIDLMSLHSRLTGFRILLSFQSFLLLFFLFVYSVCFEVHDKPNTEYSAIPLLLVVVVFFFLGGGGGGRVITVQKY